MKRVLLTLAVVGTIFLSACEKDESAQPVEKISLKGDKGISCRGCGQWDIVEPDPVTTSSASLATYDGEAQAAPATTTESKK